MAYRVVRLRREARRSAKLEDIFQVRKIACIEHVLKIELLFQERDNLEGKITLDQLADIYRIYEVGAWYFNLVYLSIQ